jgi:hypothetical protein
LVHLMWPLAILSIPFSITFALCCLFLAYFSPFLASCFHCLFLGVARFVVWLQGNSGLTKRVKPRKREVGYSF